MSWPQFAGNIAYCSTFQKLILHQLFFTLLSGILLSAPRPSLQFHLPLFFVQPLPPSFLPFILLSITEMKAVRPSRTAHLIHNHQVTPNNQITETLHAVLCLDINLICLFRLPLPFLPFPPMTHTFCFMFLYL